MAQETPTNLATESNAAEPPVDTRPAETITLEDDAATPSQPRYTLTIDETVVEKISSLAAQKVDGIIDMKGNVLSLIQEGFGGNARRKGVDADVVDGRNARIDLSIILEYGKSATSVFDELKDVIVKDIDDMTGLTVIDMTVNVVDVMSQEEYNQKRGLNLDIDAALAES